MEAQPAALDEWMVGVDDNGQPYVVRVVPDSRIGPFRDVYQAEAARLELMAASKNQLKGN